MWTQSSFQTDCQYLWHSDNNRPFFCWNWSPIKSFSIRRTLLLSWWGATWLCPQWASLQWPRSPMLYPSSVWMYQVHEVCVVMQHWHRVRRSTRLMVFELMVSVKRQWSGEQSVAPQPLYFQRNLEATFPSDIQLPGSPVSCVCGTSVLLSGVLVWVQSDVTALSFSPKWS